MSEVRNGREPALPWGLRMTGREPVLEGSLREAHAEKYGLKVPLAQELLKIADRLSLSSDDRSPLALVGVVNKPGLLSEFGDVLPAAIYELRGFPHINLVEEAASKHAQIAAKLGERYLGDGAVGHNFTEGRVAVYNSRRLVGDHGQIPSIVTLSDFSRQGITHKRAELRRSTQERLIIGVTRTAEGERAYLQALRDDPYAETNGSKMGIVRLPVGVSGG